jgi:hypothetical protein
MNKHYKEIMVLTIGALIFMKLRNTTPRGIRNNNPLNIRKNAINWQGAIGDDGAFIQFDNTINGIRAAARLLKTYRDKYGLNSVAGIVSRWAPPSENDTQSYINSVAQKTGVFEHQILNDEDYPNLIRAMIYHENGQQPYEVAAINEGFKQGFYA